MLLSIHLSQFSNPSFLFELKLIHLSFVEGQYGIVLLHAKMRWSLNCIENFGLWDFFRFQLRNHKFESQNLLRTLPFTHTVYVRLLTAVGRSAL